MKNEDHSDDLFGYQSTIHYSMWDQLLQPLPAAVPINEFFTSAVQQQYPWTNWTNGPAGGQLALPTDMKDDIQGQAAGAIPLPQAPQSPLGTTQIDFWTGRWSVGSATPGAGVVVQTNTWQKYRDHARHTDIVSPAQ